MLLKNMKKKKIFFDEIWSLSACSPLIKVNDLKSASKPLSLNQNKIILPITEYSSPIEWAFEINKNNVLKPVYKNFYKKRSQDLKKKYHDMGGFVCMTRKFLSKKSKFLDRNYQV